MGRLHIVDAEPGRWAGAVWRSAGMASVPGGGRSARSSGRARNVGTETAVHPHFRTSRPHRIFDIGRYRGQATAMAGRSVLHPVVGAGGGGVGLFPGTLA